jgi:hypothetical protein
MSKIGLIIQREYSTRVMKKSFILLTFLTPVLMVGMISLIVFLGTIKDDKLKKIIVVDKTKLYKDVLKNNESYIFQFSDALVEHHQHGGSVFHIQYIHYLMAYRAYMQAQNPLYPKNTDSTEGCSLSSSATLHLSSLTPH